MFRLPPRDENNTPRYIYLHRLENMFGNRPVLLAADKNIPLVRRLFLLKRWRDERMVYLMEIGHEGDFMRDITMQKINLHISRLRRLYLRNKGRMEKLCSVKTHYNRYRSDQLERWNISGDQQLVNHKRR
ncbi:MAG: hypothetical protein RBR86_03880 [Pseudobdellovibrionaceae bacterium]|nr:hypothetical protein [Pseudobdellovibrionaceae bacterium]